MVNSSHRDELSVWRVYWQPVITCSAQFASLHNLQNALCLFEIAQPISQIPQIDKSRATTTSRSPCLASWALKSVFLLIYTSFARFGNLLGNRFLSTYSSESNFGMSDAWAWLLSSFTLASITHSTPIIAHKAAITTTSVLIVKVQLHILRNKQRLLDLGS